MRPTLAAVVLTALFVGSVPLALAFPDDPPSPTRRSSAPAAAPAVARLRPTAGAPDLVRVVRDATLPLRSWARGVHLANAALVGDGDLDVRRPEALLYEWRDGTSRLVGVEYVVLAADWRAHHDRPAVLAGQLLTSTPRRNRFGLPAFYALRVWAWKTNPDGVLGDWNPLVSCVGYPGRASEPRTPAGRPGRP